MKTQSILKSALFAASFSAMALIGSAQAQVVNVDINGGTGEGGGGDSGTYSGQGAYSDPGNNLWNGFTINAGSTTASSGALVTSTGGTSSVTLALTSTNNLNPYDVGGAGFAPALLSDWVYSYGTPTGGPSGATGLQADGYNFTLSNLTAGHTYDLFLYAENGSAQSGGGTFTINGTSLTASNTAASQTGFVNGDNYVEFTGLTANGSNAITGAITADAVNSAPYLDGLQLVDTTAPVVVPEPSTYALMGLGALALLVISRRRRTA